jgi:hypothetical protein
MQRGIATFTLDTGRCPPWLYQRMVKLGREMVRVLVAEFGPDEFVRRIADPVWFQSLGTVLAFDWNASGLTTILTAALKEAIRHEEKDLGLFICGGKGKTSRKTPLDKDKPSNGSPTPRRREGMPSSGCRMDQGLSSSLPGGSPLETPGSLPTVSMTRRRRAS